MKPLFRLSVRRPVARDVDEEFAFHLEMRTAELIAKGWAPAAARAEARRQFGDLDDARSFCAHTDRRLEKRHMRTELFAELRQDLGFALRALRRAPAFTLLAALTLALGIGANTALFSVVRGILLRPLPFENPDELVIVAATFKGRSFPWLSPANAYDYRDQNRSIASMAVIAGHSAVITGSGNPERLRGYDVSADFFGVLGARPLQGRLGFTAEEAAWQGSKAVIVGEALWRTRFGADSALVGRTITLDNESYRVAGVAPAAMTWPADAVIWFPFTYDPAQLAGSRGAVYLNAVARLKPGITVEAAATDLGGVGDRLARQYPDMNTGLGATVIPLHKLIVGSLDQPLYLLLGGVGFVLLIACANVANLVLVRGVSREGELAVRTALGAGRGRLVRQLLTENLLLAVFGAVAGLALAVGGTRLLIQAAPSSIPRLGEVRVDGLVLAFTLVITAVTGLLFGLVPARLAVRADLATSLREGGRGSGAGRGRHRARRVLVVAEVALSVMLLAGAGLLIRSFTRLMAVDPGFRTEGSISFALSLPAAKYPTGERQPAFVASLLERLHALPGVVSAGAGMGMPLTSFSFNFSFEVVGRPPPPSAEQPDAEVRVATPEYFPTMGIPIVRGRGFSATDRAGATQALLVTEAAAKEFFAGEDPIGQRVRIGWGRAAGNLEGEIVGVVADVKQRSLATPTLPQFWVAYAQWPVSSFTVVLHTRRDPAQVMAEAQRVVHELDPDLAVAQIRTLDEVLAESVAQPRFYMLLLSVFALVAVALSAIGIYGVIAYLVGQRSREIGIRMALGASRERVVGMMVREGSAMALAGMAIGILGASILTQVMGALLFGVTPTDPATFGATAAVLAIVALAASWIPARRAARVDPALTMRAE